MITANKTSSRLIVIVSRDSRKDPVERAAGSRAARRETRSNWGLESILACRRVLPELKLDTQYFSIGDIGGVDT